MIYNFVNRVYKAGLCEKKKERDAIKQTKPGWFFLHSSILSNSSTLASQPPLYLYLKNKGGAYNMDSI